MSWSNTVMVAFVVGAVAFVAGRGWSEDAPKAMSDEEQMKAMMEMAALADQHKELAKQAGTWDADMTMYQPGKDPVKTKGVSTSRMILGGHFLVAEDKADWMGMPFEGMGITGYSKEKQKYFSIWMDVMGSTPMITWGTADATGKVITYDGEPYDCGAMGKMTPRLKISNDDADHMTFEMWAKMGNSPDYVKQMDGKYTRRK